MSNKTTPRALFAISSLGLGHATRSLVVVREFLRRDYSLTLVSHGNALRFLRQELGDDEQVEFRELPDYPPLERGVGWRLYAYLLLDLLRTWGLIRREHRAVESMAADYDFIFSDGRYGFYSRWTPSFILTHQVAFIPPKGLREASWLTEHVNVSALRKFDCVFIPDFPCPSLNLAGHLAHTLYLHRCCHRYVGILSSYRHIALEQDIDYLFVISGYLLEHKQGFIHDLLEQAAELPGRKVFVLGAASEDARRYDPWRREDLEIHAIASGELRQSLFSRARCVISRAGYTTVMDLVEHGKRGLLIPTPNQTEQEYLAYYLSSHGYFATRNQDAAFDLSTALEACAETRLFTPPWRTEAALSRIVHEIDERLHRHFIAILVPAHNEEGELEATLSALLAQHYPAGRMEIILVENGSTDATRQIAESCARRALQAGITLRVLNSEPGVSRARNTGLAALSQETEWVVMCDADTRLGPRFLQQLNSWLNRHGGEGLSVGTTRVRPHPPAGGYARLWFHLFDLVHRLSKSSFSIQIARAPIARGVGYREDLNFSEDLLFLRECRRYGRFFYVPTDQVSTSTRRFDSRGYLRQSLRWLYEALLPIRFKRYRKYDVIR
ncbi:MAG: glycosyltransferase [Candidatus Thiodiazotropha sp.]